MGCFDGYNIVADNDRTYTPNGYIATDYPGCGVCPDCSASVGYDRDKIGQSYIAALAWRSANPYLYECVWTNGRMRGTFTFRSSSLDKAREVANESVYQWDSLLVRPRA